MVHSCKFYRAHVLVKSINYPLNVIEKACGSGYDVTGFLSWIMTDPNQSRQNSSENIVASGDTWRAGHEAMMDNVTPS